MSFAPTVPCYLAGDCDPNYRGKVVRLVRYVRGAKVRNRWGQTVCWDVWDITAHWLPEGRFCVPESHLRAITDYTLTAQLENEHG